MDTLESRLQFGKVGERAVLGILQKNGFNVRPRDTEKTGQVLKDAMLGDLIVDVDGVKTLIDVKMNGSISERSSALFQGDYFAFAFNIKESWFVYLIPAPVMKAYLKTTIIKNNGIWQKLPSGDNGWKFFHKDISGIRSGITLENWMSRQKLNPIFCYNKIVI